MQKKHYVYWDYNNTSIIYIDSIMGNIRIINSIQIDVLSLKFYMPC